MGFIPPSGSPGKGILPVGVRLEAFALRQRMSSGAQTEAAVVLVRRAKRVRASVGRCMVVVGVILICVGDC